MICSVWSLSTISVPCLPVCPSFSIHFSHHLFVPLFLFILPPFFLSECGESNSGFPRMLSKQPASEPEPQSCCVLSHLPHWPTRLVLSWAGSLGPSLSLPASAALLPECSSFRLSVRLHLCGASSQLWSKVFRIFCGKINQVRTASVSPADSRSCFSQAARPLFLPASSLAPSLSKLQPLLPHIDLLQRISSAVFRSKESRTLRGGEVLVGGP